MGMRVVQETDAVLFFVKAMGRIGGLGMGIWHACMNCEGEGQWAMGHGCVGWSSKIHGFVGAWIRHKCIGRGFFSFLSCFPTAGFCSGLGVSGFSGFLNLTKEGLR